MSGPLVSAVLDDPYFQQANKSLLLVAVGLADRINDETGVCWPSIEAIAKRARTSVRGAQEALRQLQEDGKVRVEVNAGPNGTNLYRLSAYAVAPPPATNSGTPATVLNPPATERQTVAPKPEGTILSQKAGMPNENEFVAQFLPIFHSFDDFPAEPYLRARWGTYDATGWFKGQREITNWRSLGPVLIRDYRNDREKNRLGGNPNAPRKGMNGHQPKREPQYETPIEKRIREMGESQ